MTDKEFEVGSDEARAYLYAEFDRIIALADKLKIDLDLDYMTYNYKDESRPTIDEYWDGFDEDEHLEKFPEWDYTYSGWQNSSTFC